MKQFYCYTDKGKREVKEQRPDGFDKLQNKKIVMSPNIQVARLAFETDIKIKSWREND